MKKLFYITMVLMGLSSVFTTVSCIDNDPDRDSYYTFTGKTVASYLTHPDANGQFSEFVAILERAELYDLLSTYGDFTCFAPTNEAVHAYLKSRNIPVVDSLKDAECDTLAWMHIMKSSYYMTDCTVGTLPSTNMNGRYIDLSCDVDSINDIVTWRVNGSEMITRDDSVENGVVHVVNKVITASNVLVGDFVTNDPNLTLFSQALNLTGLADSMIVRFDENYKPDPEFTHVVKDSHHTRTFGDRTYYWHYPATREFKYTIFAEPDSIYYKKGINNMEDLIAYAKTIYDETYPKDAGKYDGDFTHRRNPLNRFVAYHILDRMLTWSELTMSEQQANGAYLNTFFKTEYQDIQEFYETYQPFTIMKISDAKVKGVNEKYLNRRGLENNYEVRGCRILTPDEARAIYPEYKDSPNGIYFYIDDILVYDKEKTIDQALNTRMRFDATVLSPDFSNSGARNSNSVQETGIEGQREFTMRFMPGFVKNFVFSDKSFYGVNCRNDFNNSWEGDMCACLDQFDIKFKLPPVPANMTYEVRLGYTSGERRTVVQVYFDDNLTADMPCGIPVDLRKFGGEYGWQHDDSELQSDPQKIEANDKALRNNGYMKAPDSYWFGGTGNPRLNNWNLRRILTTKFLEPEHNYYIRLRQVLENKAEMSLDYIELVPKSVYDGLEAEDKH